eukprot:g689.t1
MTAGYVNLLLAAIAISSSVLGASPSYRNPPKIRRRQVVIISQMRPSTDGAHDLTLVVSVAAAPGDEESSISLEATPEGATLHAAVAAPSDSHVLVLDLSLHAELVAAHYTVNGERRSQASAGRPCHYQGTIRGDPASRVAASVSCANTGTVDVLAIRGDGQNIIVEEHDDVDPHHGRRHGGGHHMYLREDLEHEGICEVADTVDGGGSSASRFNNNASTPLPDPIRRKLQGSDVVEQIKFIGALLISDETQAAKFASAAEAEQRGLTIANQVDVLFQPIKTRFIVVGQEVWAKDKIALSTAASTSLDNLMDHAAATLQSSGAPVQPVPDTVVLLTDRDICSSSCGTIGIAPLGAMCNFFRGSANLNEDTISLATTAETVAHEIGHTLSFQHDTPASCTTGLMAPSAGADIAPAQPWSDCSQSQYAEWLRGGGGGCLFDKPSTVSESGGVCGNGIVEGGEDCDCGTGLATVEGCSTCCDPSTCKLRSGAECGEGACCDVPNCKFKAACAACRAAVNDCDLQETCAGGVAECPANHHKPDGTACGVAGAGSVCVGGQCNSYDQQCQKLWGAGSAKAPDICYDSNKNGDKFGNCGESQGGFVACTDEDKFCGMIQCSTPAPRPCSTKEDCPESSKPFYCTTLGGTGSCYQAPAVAGTYSASQKTFADGTTCNLISQNLGADIPNPGLVHDGVACGGTKDAPKVCMGAKCIAASSLTSRRRLSRLNRLSSPHQSSEATATTRRHLDGRKLSAATAYDPDCCGGVCNGPSGGAIAGAVIGSLVGVGLLGGVIFFLWKRRQRRGQARAGKQEVEQQQGTEMRGGVFFFSKLFAGKKKGADGSAARPKSMAPSTARPKTLGRSQPLGTGQLPDGWDAAVDPSSGEVYYWHEVSGVTQWEVPTA